MYCWPVAAIRLRRLIVVASMMRRARMLPITTLTVALTKMPMAAIKREKLREPVAMDWKYRIHMRIARG